MIALALEMWVTLRYEWGVQFTLQKAKHPLLGEAGETRGSPGSVGGGVLMNRLGAMLLTTQPYFIHGISKSWLKLCHLVHFFSIRALTLFNFLIFHFNCSHQSPLSKSESYQEASASNISIISHFSNCQFSAVNPQIRNMKRGKIYVHFARVACE